MSQTQASQVNVSVKNLLARHQMNGNKLLVFLKNGKSKVVQVNNLNNDHFVDNENDVIYYSDITGVKLDFDFFSLENKDVKLTVFNEKDNIGFCIQNGKVVKVVSDRNLGYLDLESCGGVTRILLSDIIKTPKIVEQLDNKKMSIKQIVAQHQSFGNLLSIFVKTRKDKPSEHKRVTVHSVNDDFFIGNVKKMNALMMSSTILTSLT